MGFKELIGNYHKEKTPIFVNGIGIGKIIKVEDDYIEFEVVRKEEENKEKKFFKEVTQIQISKIDTISIGEKEIPKSEQEKRLSDDLGDL